MKHERFFDDFLKDNVNLNPHRLDTLEHRVSAVNGVLKDNARGYLRTNEQGSYAHQTIIKPVRENDEFDADLLLFLQDDDFNALEFRRDYVKETYDMFKNNGTYKDIVRLKTRCVTLDYKGDFHLDIVPCIENVDFSYICNRDDQRYERTDGEGYKKWLVEKNKKGGGNYLRKATRLFKFLRDHKDNFSVKSVLLTTLLGNAVRTEFPDLPTALKTLSNEVNKFLQENTVMPTVWNPVLPEEDFNRHWDKRKYANFREKFDLYNRKINDAYDEQEHNASVKAWRKLFGDCFGELRGDKPISGTTGASIAGIGTVGAVAAQKPYGEDYDD